jgi:hypothetical protein
MFGRKGLNSPYSPESSVELDQVEEDERLCQETIRAGRIIYDLAAETLAFEGRVKVEDLLATLAYNGGYSCSIEALAIVNRRATPVAQTDFSSITMPGTGKKLYFGQLPNWLLFGGRPSMLSEFLHKACSLGVQFTTNDMIDVAEDVAHATVNDRYGELNLPEFFMPSFEMQRYIDHLQLKFQIILEMVKLPLGLRPIAYGQALAQAIEAANGVVNLDLAVKLVTQCAVIAAKLDPNPVLNEAVMMDPNALRVSSRG